MQGWEVTSQVQRKFSLREKVHPHVAAAGPDKSLGLISVVVQLLLGAALIMTELYEKAHLCVAAAGLDERSERFGVVSVVVQTLLAQSQRWEGRHESRRSSRDTSQSHTSPSILVYEEEPRFNGGGAV